MLSISFCFKEKGQRNSVSSLRTDCPIQESSTIPRTRNLVVFFAAVKCGKCRSNQGFNLNAGNRDLCVNEPPLNDVSSHVTYPPAMRDNTCRGEDRCAVAVTYNNALP
ncbi:hypothetical protein CEXT_626861 [Caerostris extrusa]|uniref:Uncharacterized protein n=1 Tax=Caerostris extrusa TaxID=172846 RepID=A0AAV4MNZ4_CAEEX|nr:hypothetical protein CEXT_626861 [Caerostris extrusa]